MANPASPIADLSYRTYDGALESPYGRWWVIARMSIKMTIKKKGYWFAMLMTSSYYLIMIAVLFFVGRLSQTAGPGKNGFEQFIKGVVWKDQFLHGLSFGQMWFLIASLIIGAGSIANDTRANALLVYLSKPCTKLDYVLGKWFGIFIPLVALVMVPALVFYAYGVASFRDYGFISSDRLMFFKVLLCGLLTAAFYSSLILGISSMFKQGRTAGATFAGLYFVTNFFTVLMLVAWQQAPRDAKPVTELLSYASVDGLQIGLAKAILGTNGGVPFGVAAPRSSVVPAPDLMPVLLLTLVLMVAFVLFAWRRVRAVEIVG